MTGRTVERDYYIVWMLQKRAESVYAQQSVFNKFQLRRESHLFIETIPKIV